MILVIIYTHTHTHTQICFKWKIKPWSLKSQRDLYIIQLWIWLQKLYQWYVRSLVIQWISAAAKSFQSCPTLCNPIDGSPPCSPIPGILQARTLEWVVISFSNAWKWKVNVKLLSHVRLRDPMDCSLPGSSIHGKSTGVGCHCLLCGEA